MAFDTYDENGNLLEPVPGLGLASSPATELMTPGVTSGAQPSIAEPSVFAHPSTLPIPPTGTPGLNFTPSPPTQSEQEYLQSLPTTQKIGLALQAFSAGVAGRENPIESLLKQRRADLASNQAKLNSTLDLAIKGQVLLSTLPEGSLQKTAIRRELSRMAPEMSDFFNSTDEERKDEMQTIRTIKNPLVQKEVLNRCGGKSGSGFSKCVFDIVDDPKKMQTLRETAAESVWTPTMQALRPAIDQAKKQGLLDEYKQEDGTYRIPQEEAIELAEKSGIFKPEMIDAMRTFPERLVRFGVVPTETLVKVQEVGLSEAAKGSKYNVGDTRQELDPQGNTKQMTVVSFDAKGNPVWEETGRKRKELTLAQQLHDERVLRAREAIEGVTKEEMIQRRDKFLPGGEINEDYDPDIARNWRLAGEPLFSDPKAKSPFAHKSEEITPPKEPKESLAKPEAPSTAISSDVNAPSATGASGFVGGMANTIADMVGMGLPYPEVERGTQALKNLFVQTITLMQDAVPGRPSNYLMKQLEQLAVKPASLLMADQRALERLTQTRSMLKTEVNRMEREVLANPSAYTRAEVSKTRSSQSQIKQLMREYDQVIESFNKPKNEISTDAESSDWTNDKERRYQELLRKKRETK